MFQNQCRPQFNSTYIEYSVSLYQLFLYIYEKYVYFMIIIITIRLHYFFQQCMEFDEKKLGGGGEGWGGGG